MARFNPIKNSFVAGELSPRLEGRDDLEQYHQGLRQSENGIILPHGGWRRRPGTHYVAEVSSSSFAARLIPFIYSIDVAYVIVANNGVFRYFSNEAAVVSAGAFADGALFADGGGFADVGDPIEDTIPYAASELFGLQWAQTGDVMYFVHPNHPTYKLSRLSSTNFRMAELTWRAGRAPLLTPNVTTTTLAVTGSGPSYTITASADVFDTSSADSDVGRAVRIHGDSTDEGWYKITAVTSATVATATHEGGESVAGDAANDDWALGMFSDTEGARAIAFHENRLWFGGCLRDPERIVGSDSGVYNRFNVDATVDDNSVAVSSASTGQIQTVQWLASTDKALWVGCFSGEGVVEAPDDAVITPSSARFRPRTKRGSIHIAPALVDSDILFVQRDARKLRRLSFELASDRYGAGDISILAEHILRGGAVEMQYQQSPDSVIWIVRGDGQLIGFTIEPEQKVIGAHRHIFAGTSDAIGTGALCESVAVIPSPDGSQDQVWVVVKRRIDGGAARYVEYLAPPFDPAITVRSTQEERVNALDDVWYLDSALELNSPQTITAITKADPGVVTATNHGLAEGDLVQIRGVYGMTEVNRRHFTATNVDLNTFELFTDAAVPLPVDTSAYTTYISGGQVRKLVETVTGLDHLEGETVSVLADAAAHPDKTVASGAITLDRPAGRVQVGLHRKAFCETQRFVGGGRIGSDQGQRARIQRVALRFLHSVECSVGVGPDPANLETLRFREGSWSMDAPPALFTGDIDVPLEGPWSREPTVYVEQSLPLPLTVLSSMPRAESGEK